jgi:hypothetical protein
MISSGAAIKDAPRSTCRDGEKSRKEELIESVPEGSRPFVEKVKAFLGFRALEGQVLQGLDAHHIKEERSPYKSIFGPSGLLCHPDQKDFRSPG